MMHEVWRKTVEGQSIMLRCWLLSIEHAVYRGGVKLSQQGTAWERLCPHSTLAWTRTP